MNDFVNLIEQSEEMISKIAFVIDLRAGKLFDMLDESINGLRKKVDEVEILYLESNDETILKRYKESRRSHPYSSDGTLTDGIYLERKRLLDIRNKADYIIDTSNLNIHQLRDRIKKTFASKTERGLSIVLISFGFKKGIPLDVDMLFDLRFLPNPFYVDALRSKTGMDREIREYVMNSSVSQEMLERMIGMLDFLIPQFKVEGKSEIIIGIGCTGGNHRSVTFTYLLEEHFRGLGHEITVVHRDMKGQ
jgi:UPF0042 nucleotide-binding protein